MTRDEKRLAVVLNGDWGDRNTQILNRRKEWIPNIPLPRYYYLFGYRCTCERFCWTLNGYQGHYALEHVLALEPWVRSESRRYWRRQWFLRRSNDG